MDEIMWVGQGRFFLDVGLGCYCESCWDQLGGSPWLLESGEILRWRWTSAMINKQAVLKDTKLNDTYEVIYRNFSEVSLALVKGG